MTMEIIALLVEVVVSIVLPLVVLGILIKRNKKQWRGIFVLFFCGGVTYAVMQWGMKEHGLTWLFNNTDFMDFMDKHYIPYLLVVAFAGALLSVLAYMLVFAVIFRRKLSFGKVVAYGLGYGMVESYLLVGEKSIRTVIQLVKGTEMEMSATVGELFLSGYERILLPVIEIAILVVLVYFIKKKMTVQGGLVAVFCQTMIAFLPGFFIAFTLSDYYEVFDRSMALGMVYIVLTASAVASLIVLYAFRKMFNR